MFSFYWPNFSNISEPTFSKLCHMIITRLLHQIGMGVRVTITGNHFYPKCAEAAWPHIACTVVQEVSSRFLYQSGGFRFSQFNVDILTCPLLTNCNDNNHFGIRTQNLTHTDVSNILVPSYLGRSKLSPTDPYFDGNENLGIWSWNWL